MESNIPADFKQQFMGFISGHNSFRRQNPEVFDTKDGERNRDFVRDKLRFLTPVRCAATRDIEEMLKQEDTLRKVKALNYGKWYLKPHDFNKKVSKLNKRLDLYVNNNNSNNA